MQAMEYEITLPADYDMEIIRNRIATRGHLMDAYPGLGLKAYLVRERGDGVHLPQGTPPRRTAAERPSTCTPRSTSGAPPRA